MIRNLPIFAELEFLQLLSTKRLHPTCNMFVVAMWVVLGSIHENRHQSFAMIDNKEIEPCCRSREKFLKSYSAFTDFGRCSVVNFGLFSVLEFALASSIQYLVC